MERVMDRVRRLDTYPKINEDFYKRTVYGGLITLVSSFIMLLLFLSEFRSYVLTETVTKLAVDTSRGEKLHIHFDVTFPFIPCALLSVDAMDISGEQHLDIRHDINKKRHDEDGSVIGVRPDSIGAPVVEKPLQSHGGRLEHNETYCGSCFGAATSDEDCCNSCEQVREAYRRKGWGVANPDLIDQCKRENFIQRIREEQGEGCTIVGSLEVNKVAGNFHFAPGKSFHQSNVHIAELMTFQIDTYNITHTINKLSFGEYYPGSMNPLDGVKWVQGPDHGTYEYFLKVVPTIYTDIRGHNFQSNQFSTTEHFKSVETGHSKFLPGIFFYYDLSPIKVTFTEERTSFFHFMTHVCAIVGGIFTVAGIVDSFIYHGSRDGEKESRNRKIRLRF